MQIVLHRFADIHTHQLGHPDSILSIPVAEVESLRERNRLLSPEQRQCYSLQLHPWHLTSEADIQQFVQRALSLANDPELVAIGECGLDGICPTPLALQEQAFTAALQVAHQLGLPVIIHCVRHWSLLLKLVRASKCGFAPGQLIIHGFRKGPALAQQLLDAGFSLSLGKQFHPDVLQLVPTDRLYNETDAE